MKYWHFPPKKQDKGEEKPVLCFNSHDARCSIYCSPDLVTETERLVNKWHSSICALSCSDLQRVKSKIGTRSALATRPSGKIQMSSVLSEKVKPGEAKEFGTSWSACLGNSFGIARGGEGVSGGVREVSAATSVWSLHYILLQPTLDCGRRHFCRVRKWPSTRLPDITPKPGIIAPSLKPPNNAYTLRRFLILFLTASRLLHP